MGIKQFGFVPDKYLPIPSIHSRYSR